MKLQFASTLGAAAMVMGVVLGPQSARAGVSVTASPAGVQASTMSNIVTEDFNSMSLGVLSTNPIVTDVGTYTASPTSSVILMADQYGGADNSQYISVGSQAHGSGGTLTLALNGPADYFGMWWSAIDSQNSLDFYTGGIVDQAHLVAHFDSTNLPASLSATAYSGNPNNGLNMGEKYAYLNFSGTAGTTFDTIVFSNNGSTGFESDNHSVHSVPEPSALLMGGAASLIGLAAARRRGRKV